MLRVVSILLVCAISFGCGLESLPTITNIQGEMVPPPRPGVASMFSGLMVPVPGGRVNASGGNLFLARRDMSVGTRVHEWAVGSAWNSATGRWQWSFDLSLVEPRPGQPAIFTDATGYAAFLKGVEVGKRIPGTRWFAHSAKAVRSAGGLIHHFDNEGWLARVHWASRAYPSIEFVRADVAGKSRVTRIDQCTSASTCSALYAMSFDGQGRIASITDHTGRYVLYGYADESERLTSVQDPYDVQRGWAGTQYEYDEQGRLDAVVNSHGERVEYRYCDTSNAVCEVRQVGEGDPTWKFAFGGMKADREHASTVVTDPLGKSASFVFDFGLRTKSYTNPDGETWSWNWSHTELTGITSPAGVYTGFDLSSDQSVLTVGHSSGNSAVTTYAPFPAENRAAPFERAIASVVDNVGAIESRTYTANGELASVTNGEGETTTYLLAANEDLTVSEPDGIGATYSNRGDHGGYATVTKGGKTINRSYDALGNLLSVDGLLEEDLSLHSLSPGQGGVVSRTYDADRNVASILLEDSTGATQSTLVLEWRADHQLELVDRPHGGDTERLYDALGRVEEVRTRVDGTWQDTHFEYDLAGRTTATLRPNGMATRWSYRDSGEIASIQHERDWSDPLESDGLARFTYLAGQQTEIRDAAHGMVPEQYTYDSAGRVQAITFPGGERLEYVYDLRGRTTSETYRRPNSAVLRTFEYDYDLANRITAVREDGVEIQGTTWVDGHADRVDYGNGVEVVHGYDAYTGAFAGFTATDAAQQVIAQMTVNRTTCGIALPATRCVIEQTQTFSGVSATSYAEYQLDDLGTERLLADSTGAVTPIDRLYQYDELSNLVQSPEGDFVYNAERNRLLEVQSGGSTVVDYTYDAAGFVTARDGLPITWNGMGRVATVGDSFSVQWDALARKVSKTESGETTLWRYGGALTEDDLGTNQKIDLGWVVVNIDDDSHDYRLFDFRGNAKLTLDDAGAVTSHQHYAGYDRIGVDGASPAAMGFAGGYHAGDLVVLGARVYDPAFARFLSEDPIPQVVNQNAYTLGNPVRFWDSTGREPVPTGFSVTERDPTYIWNGGGEIQAFGVAISGELSIVFHGDSFTTHYGPDAVSTPGGPDESCQCSRVGTLGGGDTSFSINGGSGEAPAFGDEAGGNGSVGRGKDGPARRGFHYGTDSAKGFDEIICGLGYEICLAVGAVYWLRARRRVARCGRRSTG